jgi:uncharacterized membrane protein
MGVLATIVELGSDDTLYGILLFLHILSAIVGFGPLVANGLYGQQAAKRPGPGGVAIGQASFAVTKVAEMFVYAVFVTGILLVLTAENDRIEFGDTWIVLSILLYVVALGYSHAVQIPAARQMNALGEELLAAGPPPEGQAGPPPQALAMQAVGKKLAMGGMFLNLMLVAILYLMIWKPGWP